MAARIYNEIKGLWTILSAPTPRAPSGLMDTPKFGVARSLSATLYVVLGSRFRPTECQ
jgi:hypothetical protein